MKTFKFTSREYTKEELKTFVLDNVENDLHIITNWYSNFDKRAITDKRVLIKNIIMETISAYEIDDNTYQHIVNILYTKSHSSIVSYIRDNPLKFGVNFDVVKLLLI